MISSDNCRWINDLKMSNCYFLWLVQCIEYSHPISILTKSKRVKINLEYIFKKFQRNFSYIFKFLKISAQNINKQPHFAKIKLFLYHSITDNPWVKRHYHKSSWTRRWDRDMVGWSWIVSWFIIEPLLFCWCTSVFRFSNSMACVFSYWSCLANFSSILDSATFYCIIIWWQVLLLGKLPHKSDGTTPRPYMRTRLFLSRPTTYAKQSFGWHYP